MNFYLPFPSFHGSNIAQIVAICVLEEKTYVFYMADVMDAGALATQDARLPAAKLFF